MRSSLVVLGAIVLASVAVLHASTGPIPLNCNRACLENLVDQYLAAVVAHDPKRLPLSKDVMYTDNDQVIEVGDGFWKTAEGRGNYTHIFADPDMLPGCARTGAADTRGISRPGPDRERVFSDLSDRR